MNPNNIVGNIIICTKADNCYLSCNQISIVSHQTCLNLYFCAVQEINKRWTWLETPLCFLSSILVKNIEKKQLSSYRNLRVWQITPAYFGFFTRCLRIAFFVFTLHLSPQKLKTSCTTVVGKSDREMLGFSVTLLLHPPLFPPYCEGSLLGTFLKASKAYGHLKDQLWTWGQIIHTQFHQELLRNIQSLGI